MVSRVGGTVPSRTDAVTLLAAPTALGPITVDQGRPTLTADVSAGTYRIRTTFARTGNAIPIGVAPGKQTVKQPKPSIAKSSKEMVENPGG